MKPLRGFAAVERSCLCHPRRRGVLRDNNTCPMCGGTVSESMDQLTQLRGRPIEVR